MHCLEPFLPDLGITPDHNDADIYQEIRILGIIERQIAGFLKGISTLDDLDQCLAQFGVNPYEYWDVVCDNVDAVLDRKEPLEDIDILVPVLIDQYGSPITTIS